MNPKNSNELSNKRLALFEQACNLGIKEVVEFLLKNDFVNINDAKTFWSGMNASFAGGNVEIANFLIKGCNLEESCCNITPEEISALAHQAYNYKLFDVAKEIITQVCPNLDVLQNGKSLLYKAVEDRNVDFVDFLLSIPSINLFIGTSKGETPIFVALQNKDVEMANMILKARQISYFTGLPLAFDCALMAYKLGANNLASFILNIPNIEINDKKLFDLLQDGEKDFIFEVLNSPYANINAVSWKRGSLLSFAIALNNNKIACKILEHPDININRNNCSYMPLATACRVGNIEMVKKLLERPEIDDNAFGWSEISPLSYSVKYPEILKLLLARPGIHVRWVDDRKGNNALMAAIEEGVLESVDLLLKHGGININAVNKDFSCLLHPIDPLVKQSSIVAYRRSFLLGNGMAVGECLGKGVTALQLAVALGYEDIALRLLEVKGIRCSQKMPNNTTLLHWAIFKKMNKLVEKLITREDVYVNAISGASSSSIPLASSPGVTPLTYCVNVGNVELFKLLLNHEEIDVNALNECGEPVLTKIFKKLDLSGNDTDYEFFELLLQKPELDLNAPDGSIFKIKVFNRIFDNALTFTNRTRGLALLNKYRKKDVQKYVDKQYGQIKNDLKRILAQIEK